MTDTKETQKSELAELKKRADMLDIKYPNNIKVETLREKVNEKLAPAQKAATAAPQSKAVAIRKEATKLVRVKITCLNPSKRDSEGEFFRTGNRYVPTISRFIPFEQETHIENMLLTLIKNREYSIVVHEKNSEGRKSPVRKQRKEFQIEVLAPLTKEELKELAESQIARRAI